MRRARYWKLLIGAATLLFVLVNWLNILTLFTMGYWPEKHVEHLRNPITINGWSSTGLRAGDGRTIPLPGFTRLPAQSEALRRATARGVEIMPDGRVIGLVEVHHWCGNDHLRYDRRRVDLGLLLEFFREGDCEKRLPSDAPKPLRPGGVFGKYGWNVSEYSRYEAFVKGDWPKWMAAFPDDDREAKTSLGVSAGR